MSFQLKMLAFATVWGFIQLVAAAVLISQTSGVHNELTHWGSLAYVSGRIAYTALYISGVPLIRSLFWNIAAFGMLAVLAAPFLLRQAEALSLRTAALCSGAQAHRRPLPVPRIRCPAEGSAAS